MKYLKIQNNGELDVRLISLMGGSTKTGNEYKIGRFGSGLKYSLSWLIRNNINFKIFIGEKEVEIKTVTEKIQDVDFEILYINGEKTSITSNMGIDWEAWMICRELWCNALDETGGLNEVTETIVGEANKTTFYIQSVGGIKETIDKWGNYFIHDQKPICESPNKSWAVYPGGKTLKLYKHGVLIHEEEGFESALSYDIRNASINELREYKGCTALDIFDIIKDLDKNAVELFLARLDKKCYEYDMDYNWSGKMNKSWSEAIGAGKIIAKEDMDAFKARGIEIDEAAHVVVPKGLFSKLAEDHPHTSAVRRADKVNAFFETGDQSAISAIKQALVVLEECNYYIDPELKWIVGVFGNPETFAKINMDTKIIMFSQELARKSLFDTVTTVIEENEHFISGHADCTRSFQQHFIDLFTKQLLQRNEVTI